MSIALSKPTKALSLEEFLTLPETKPASEYMNEQIYQKPMPQGKHSKLQIGFASQINQKGEAACITSVGVTRGVKRYM